MLRLPILVLLVAASLAAGCGGGEEAGGDGVPPGEWAQSVCGALSSWQGTLQQESESLGGAVLGAEDPQAAKDQIGTFLDNVIAETETMIGAVRAAGQPGVEDGDRIAEDFHEGLQQMRTAFEDARQSLEDVPTDDPQAFQQELTEIGTQLQTQGETIGNSLADLDQKYDAEELSQAFDDTPACQDFVQQSG